MNHQTLDLNLATRFKYNMLVCCQLRNIYSIDIQTTACTIREIDDAAQGYNPHTDFFWKLTINAKMIAWCKVWTPNWVMYKLWTHWCTVALYLIPKFKYRTLRCFWNILSIYIQTTSGSVRENDHRVQGWNPVSIYFRKFNTIVHGR